MKRKSKVLFLCTGNSCRSQMAEGFARALRPQDIDPYSAGIETHGLNPWAVRVMAEAGVDISKQSSKKIIEVLHIPFDLIVTVCDHARETCPIFPREVPLLHQSFPDPPRCVSSSMTQAETLKVYSQVRDQIRDFILNLKVDPAL